VVGVVGEAGVGKSRLLLEMKNRLSPGEHIYLEGRCLQYGGSIIYLPILDILRLYFEIKEGDQEPVTKEKMKQKILHIDENLIGILPAMQELLSFKVEDEVFNKLEPKDKRERTFEAIRDLLIRVSQENPLVLVVEDLHWIDKTSEEFLDYLIGWLAKAPILLILLYRPEYTHQWGSKSFYTKVGVDQLGAASSAELVKFILEEGEVVPELRQLILDRSAGNPLFMEEFTHALLENDSIVRKDEKYVFRAKASDIQVPDTIHGIIAARMDSLEDNLKRTMQVASVIGRDFAFRILQAITGMREELKSYLLNLQGLEFIYEKSLFPELEYLFKHALTQEVAYNSLLLKKRKEIHAKIGKAIEKIYPKRLEEFYEVLAYHYSKSDNLKKAFQYSRLSGEKAEGHYSHWEAYGFYKKALDLINKLPETRENKEDKFEVIFLMYAPMAWLGFPEDSLAMLQEGERLSKELGKNSRLAGVHNLMGIYYSFKGKAQLAKKYSEDAFEEALKNQDIELIVPLALNLYLSYQTKGEYYKIADTAPGVIELIEKAKREVDFFSQGMNPYSQICSYCGHSMVELGNFEDGERFHVKGLSNASKINELITLTLVEMMYGFLFFNRGNWEAASDHFLNSINHGEAAKVPFLSATALSGLGYVCSLLGDPKTGTKQAQNALEMYRNSGVEMNLSLLHYYLALIHLDHGNLTESRRLTQEAIKLSLKNNEKSVEGINRILLGRILGKTEPARIDKAEESILKGMKILNTLKIKPDYVQGSLFLGELYLDAGKKEKALKYLQEAEGSFQQMGMDYWLTRTQAVLSRL
jgi:tetratricopeptide (TPR) repeat protein